MTVIGSGPAERPGLIQAIQQSIARRTRIQISNLSLEVTSNRVALTGFVSCYYLKQLILQGVLDAVGSNRDVKIELNIQVRGDTAQ
jgi:predicted amino acid-binding ACT domain protein